jgi:hypothetical protein
MIVLYRYNGKSYRVTYYMGQVTEVCEVRDSNSVFFGDSMGSIYSGYQYSVALAIMKYLIRSIDKLITFIGKVNKRGGEPFMKRGSKALGFQYPMLHLSRGGSEEAIEIILKDPRVK